MRGRGRFDSVGLGRCSYAGFVVYGILEILVALTLAVVYFKIRGFTTSLDKVETVPTYANAIMLMCTGILNIVLYIKRDAILLWPTGALCVVCLLFFSTCAILSGIQTARTFQKIQTCAHNLELYQCECYIAQKGVSGSSLIAPAVSKLVYEGAPSCDGIQFGLRNCMYVLYGLYALGAVLCLCGFLMVLVINNKTRKHYPVTGIERDYIELLRSGSTVSNFSIGAQSLDHGTDGTRDTALSTERIGQPLQPRRNPPKRRRRAKFCKQITLPGMGFCLLNQQLGLPGEDHLRLLSVQRTGSFDRGPDPRVSAGQADVHSRHDSRSPTGTLQGVQRNEVSQGRTPTPGDGLRVITENSEALQPVARGSGSLARTVQPIERPVLQRVVSPMHAQNIDSAGHAVQRTDSQRHVLYRSDSPRHNVPRTEGIAPGIHRTGPSPNAIIRVSSSANVPQTTLVRVSSLSNYNPRVQRSVSLQQVSPSNSGYRPPAHPRQFALTRSQSDTIQGQRAVNLFRIDRAVQQNRNPANGTSSSGTPSGRPSPVRTPTPSCRTSPSRSQGVAQRSQSDRVQSRPSGAEQCSHCREYRRFRRVCRAYSSCLPAQSQMYPLPQHVMMMNYLMSTQGRSGRLPAGMAVPRQAYEAPPPYHEDGPPPYSPGPYRRSLGYNQ